MRNERLRRHSATTPSRITTPAPLGTQIPSCTIAARAAPLPTNPEEVTVFWLIASLSLLAGLFLLTLSGTWDVLDAYPTARALMREFGALLSVTTALSVVWEYSGKKQFLGEILQTTRLATGIEASGLDSVHSDFQSIDWNDRLNATTRLDLLFAYGRTWINVNRAHLEKIARKPGAKVRLLLPDPECDWLCAALGQRFSEDAATVRQRLTESRNTIVDLFEGHPATIEVYFHTRDPLYSAYLYEGGGVISLYHMRRQRNSVPALTINPGGSLHQWVETDLERILSYPDTRRSFPEAPHV